MLERFLRIDLEEATFRRRGFRDTSPAVRTRLEHVGQTFLQGYHAALEDRGLTALRSRLEAFAAEFRGFAYEGAAMALDLLDQMKPWGDSRIRQFLDGPAAAHVYMIHVGIGWSMARLPFRIRNRWPRLHPLLRWLVLDGYGFHEGYFHWPRYSSGFDRPRRLHGYELRAFDQGLGRSLWFVSGADPEWIAGSVAGFPEGRRADLWSGAGLACAYAGGSDESKIRSLEEVASHYRDHLGQGAVFAAGARQCAGNPADHTDLACGLLCGISAREAAALSEDTRSQAREDHEPAYEAWRRLIRAHLHARRTVDRSLESAALRVPGPNRRQERSQYVQ